MAYVMIHHHPGERGNVDVASHGGATVLASSVLGDDRLSLFFPTRDDLDTWLAAVTSARDQARTRGQATLSYELGPEPDDDREADEDPRYVGSDR